MASDLSRFAKRIRVLGARVEGNFNRTVQRAAIAVGQTVVLATPVDTGRARGNWQASLGTPLVEESGREDPSGAATVSANNATISARTARGGQAVFISNNVPYIQRLNQGYSAQAPAGFVEQAINVGLRAVRTSRNV